MAAIHYCAERNDVIGRDAVSIRRCAAINALVRIRIAAIIHSFKLRALNGDVHAGFIGRQLIFKITFRISRSGPNRYARSVIVD